MEMMLSAIMVAEGAHEARQAVTAAMGSAWLILVIAAFLGILTLTLVVTPNLTQKSATALRERNVVCFFTGLLLLAGFAALAVLGQVIKPLLAVVLVAFAVLLILAWATAAEDIGRRLFAACGKDASRWTCIASGWLVFAFSSLVPVIGWFAVFPYVTLSGLGSVVLTTMGSNLLNKAPAPAEPPKA